MTQIDMSALDLETPKTNGETIVVTAEAIEVILPRSCRFLSMQPRTAGVELLYAYNGAEGTTLGIDGHELTPVGITDWPVPAPQRTNARHSVFVETDTNPTVLVFSLRKEGQP